LKQLVAVGEAFPVFLSPDRGGGTVRCLFLLVLRRFGWLSHLAEARRGSQTNACCLFLDLNYDALWNAIKTYVVLRFCGNSDWMQDGARSLFSHAGPA
jgi:hypothetical protein